MVPRYFLSLGSFPLDKVSLTFSLQDLFDLEFLFFLWLVIKCFLQECALVS